MMLTTLAVLGIALLWTWSLLGRRAYRAYTSGRLFENRQAATMQPFALLLGVAAAAPFSSLHAAGAPFIGIASALIYARYVALDPLRSGFWHHRRLRPIGVGVCLGVGATIAWYAPAPAMAPLLFAALVFNRYLKLSVAITEQQLADLEAQRQKLLSYTATDLAASAVDKISKAG